jgi:UDP-GlcNAc:undecaprenyl-phosphate/decaprenyl-phosphate GlcNAc-1-phosphate transferase
MVENLLLGGLFSFCITFYAIPKVLKIAINKKLFDIPNDRKVHTTPIPSLGGVAIFAGFILSLLLVGTIELSNALQCFILTFIVVFFFGIKDDLVGLTPQKKMFGQVVASAILIWKANILITNMHGFIGIHSINGGISYVLTVLTIIVIMNAYNLIDGIDGLAATISIITASVFGWFFYANGDYTYALLGITFTGSLCAFLIFNYAPAKIFMGDTGSMLCGIVNAILVIHFIETANSTKLFQVTSSPALGFGILIMPLLDTLRVFGIRILHGKSPFYPDRNHLHHILLDRGLSHKVITLIMGLSAITFIVLTYVALPLGTTPVILLQTSLFLAGVFFLQITGRKAQAKLKALNNEENITLSKKIKHVVTLIVAKETPTKVVE